MSKLIDMEAIISGFGQQAVRTYIDWDMKRDDGALDAIENRGHSDRHTVIRSWLGRYAVFQGFNVAQRDSVTKTVLQWADERAINRKLGQIDLLCDVHQELMKACAEAFGKARDFTSLASKALWLCYPEDVPMFDAIAQRALWIVSKLDRDTSPLDSGTSRYSSFVYAWMALYKRYSESLGAIDMGSCRYRVRIFDRILLRLGENSY